MRDVDPWNREDDLAHAAGSTLVDFGERAGQSIFSGQLDLEDQVDRDQVDQDDEDLLDDEWWDEPEDDDQSAAASSMRVLRIVAAVAAIGWLIALLMNFFGPSTLVDTTDGEQETAPVPPDDQAGIGGGLQVDEAGGDEAAQVLRVGEGGGPVVAGEGTAPGESAPTDATDPEADGSAPTSDTGEAANGEAPATAPGPSPDSPSSGGSGPPAGLPSGYSENWP